MERFIGTLTQDGETLVENLEVHHGVRQVGALLQHHGYIITNLGYPTLPVNTRLLLTAEDGRSGMVFFCGVVPFATGTTRQIELTFEEDFR